MGDLVDIKRKKLWKFLKWLNTQDGFEVSNGGKHQIVIRYKNWDRPYPIPFKHNVVSKIIIEGLLKKITSVGLHRREDLIDRLK